MITIWIYGQFNSVDLDQKLFNATQDQGLQFAASPAIL